MQGIFKYFWAKKFSFLLVITIISLFFITISGVYINPKFHTYNLIFQSDEGVKESTYSITKSGDDLKISGFKDVLINKKNADEVFKNELAELYTDYQITSEVKLDKTAKVSLYLNLLLGTIIGTIIFIITSVISFKKGETHILDDEFYDNKRLFKYPFSKNYNKLALNSLKTTKQIALFSILIALIIVAKAISIPSGFANLGLGFTYLVLALSSMIYGPFVGLLIGFISDNIGFFLFPSGASYSFLYVFNAMFTCFIYGTLFYRTKITFTKVLIARLIVNLFVNGFLGSIWFGIYMKWDFEMTKIYMLFTSIPKNLVYLLPQTLLLFITIKVLSKHLSRRKIIDDLVSKNITLI